MADDTDKLIARADAAIAEAERLMGINETWQRWVADQVDGMFWRFSEFRAVNRAAHYPQEFNEQRPPYQPFPSEDKPASSAGQSTRR